MTINVGEKATLPALVTALGRAGHASTPQAGANAVPRLATLIGRLADHRPPRRLLPETRALLEALVGEVDEATSTARSTARSGSIRRSPRLIAALFGITIAPTRLHRLQRPQRDARPCERSTATAGSCRRHRRDARASSSRDALGTDVAATRSSSPSRSSAAPWRRWTRRCSASAGPPGRARSGAVLLPTLSHRIHRLALPARRLRHHAYGMWPIAPRPARCCRRHPQPRRADPRRRPRIRPRLQPARGPRGGRAHELSGAARRSDARSTSATTRPQPIAAAQMPTSRLHPASSHSPGR